MEALWHNGWVFANLVDKLQELMRTILRICPLLRRAGGSELYQLLDDVSGSRKAFAARPSLDRVGNERERFRRSFGVAEIAASEEIDLRWAEHTLSKVRQLVPRVIASLILVQRTEDKPSVQADRTFLQNLSLHGGNIATVITLNRYVNPAFQTTPFTCRFARFALGLDSIIMAVLASNDALGRFSLFEVANDIRNVAV